jgi:hypothetical protein
VFRNHIYPALSSGLSPGTSDSNQTSIDHRHPTQIAPSPGNKPSNMLLVHKPDINARPTTSGAAPNLIPSNSRCLSPYT